MGNGRDLNPGTYYNILKIEASRHTDIGYCGLVVITNDIPRFSGGNQQQNFHQGGGGRGVNHHRGARGGTPQRGGRGSYHGNNISPGFNRNDGG